MSCLYTNAAAPQLEDIYASLYLVRCDLSAREGRRVGDKQPPSAKFFQGVLLFALLLAVLWAPLLLYSSGNPTLFENP